MSAPRHVQLNRFVRRCVSQIEKTGLKVRLGSDFEELRSLVDGQPLRSPLAPIFDPVNGYVNGRNGFWIAVLEGNGEVVVTEALMQVDLGGDTLAEHLSQHLDWYRPPGDKVCCERTRISLSSTAQLSGRLVYNGEMWIKGGEQGYRGSSLIGLVPRAAMALALMQWQPDHIFALVETGSALKGLTVRCGFTHLEQGSIDWHHKLRPEPLEEWVAWLSADDADHLMAISPERLDAMLGGIPQYGAKAGERLIA